MKNILCTRLPDALIQKISVALFAVLFISTVSVKGQGCSVVPLTISVTTTQATCVTGGCASINIISGNQPYIYTWCPNVSTTNTASNLAPGTYTVSVTDTRCHTLPGQELVINGDFSAGNTGFSSNYIYCNSSGCLQTKGTYAVGSDPTFYHDNFLGAAHSTGNCMIINGAETPATSLWSQTVTVTRNTNYVFSTWVSSMNTISPAQLQFAINGK